MKRFLLEQDIDEQPEVIQRLVDQEAKRVEVVAGALRGRFDYIVIAARGSSDNGARYAQYLFGAQNGLPVALAAPSLFTLYRQPPKLAHALVIGISQSGQALDVVEVVREARRQGQPTIGVTNVPQSPLAEIAEYVILLHAGRERAIAATKTYTASLGALALLSCFLNKDRDRLTELHRLPELMQETLLGLKPLAGPMEGYHWLEHCAVIGRGYNYSTAFEIALKVKELTRAVAQPYSSADFRHGPIAMVGTGFPVMMIALQGALIQDLRALAADLRKLKCELLLISDDASLLDQANLALPVPPGVPEWLTPFLAVLAGQRFSLTVARAKGLDPDRPHGLTKVTRTL